MSRPRLALIVSMLALAPWALNAGERTPKQSDQANPNQIYIKLIMSNHAEKLDKGKPVVESWIAAELKKRGQDKFTAVTGWVQINPSPTEATEVWEGNLDNKTHYCPVGADVPSRTQGRIQIIVGGWSPVQTEVTVSLMDEPGSRKVVAVEQAKTKQGGPYVAVLIGPPHPCPVNRNVSKK